MSNLANRIEDLGGVKFLDNQNLESLRDESLAFVEKIMGALLETDVVELISQFGNSRFNNDVFAKTINKSKFLQSEEIEIGTLFGWGESKESVQSIIKQYHTVDQVNLRFFPLFEGYPGDIIYYSLEEDSFGKIYYWHHESFLDDEAVCIANSLSDFVDTFFIEKETIVEEKPLSDEELEQINIKRKKVGLPLIDKFKNII
jgi:hypothetical protein